MRNPMRNPIRGMFAKPLILLMSCLAMLSLPLLAAGETGDDIPDKRIVLSGRVTLSGGEEGLGGVRILAVNGHMDQFSDVLAVTTEEGRFEMLLPYGWSGFILPDKTGYNFDPPRRDYGETASSHDGQNFTALRDPEVVIISGKVGTPEGEGIANVRVTAIPNDGDPGDGSLDPNDETGEYPDGPMGSCFTYTNEEGRYSLGVPKGWTGRAVPSKYPYRFEPEERVYENLQEDSLSEQDFVGVKQGPHVIAGCVLRPGGEEGIAGVRILPLPPNIDIHVIPYDASYTNARPIFTNDNGRFEIELPHGWSGTLLPQKLGYNFDPEQRSYKDLSATIDDQNFEGERDEGIVLISGRVRTASGEGIRYVRVSADSPDDPTIGGTDPESPGENGDVGDPNYAGNFTFTDERGFYQLAVSQGWSGSVTPVREHYEFDPLQRLYEDLPTGDLKEQDFTGIKREPVVLSGRVTHSGTEEGVAGVRIWALLADGTAADYPAGETRQAFTNDMGRYELQVPYGWTGILLPNKQHLIFDPPSRSYENLTSSEDGQDFTARRDPEIVLISGRVATLDGDGLRNIRVSARPLDDGTPEGGDDGAVNGSGDSPGNEGDGNYTFTDEHGRYQLAVPVLWSGVVTPYKRDFRFDPSERTYALLEPGDLSDQDFVGVYYVEPPVEITGRVALASGEGIEGVVVVPSGGYDPVGEYLDRPDAAAVTDAEGRYSLPVPHGWSGSLTPFKDFHRFDPSRKVYDNVTVPLADQDFIGAPTAAVQISGTVRTPDGGAIEGASIVVSHPMCPGTDLEAGTDDPLSPYFHENAILTDAEGRYALEVPEGWSGRIGPYKHGYSFVPSHQIYSDVASDLDGQDFVGTSNLRAISGQVHTADGLGLGGVAMTGSDGIGPVLSDEEGFYSLLAPSNRRIRVVPWKKGYAFDPPSRDYGILESDLEEQNYAASPTTGTLGTPVLDFLEVISDGHVGIRWNNAGDAPARFFALAWDLYAAKWIEREKDGSVWHDFDPGQNSGDLDLGLSGGYFAWITNLHEDGSFFICENPAAFIMSSGIPHKPLDVSTASGENGKVRLNWKPDIYGTWLYWTIVYDIDSGEFIPSGGPLGEGGLWHYMAYGSEDFNAGLTELTVPSGGRYWIFLAAMSWDAKTWGEFEAVYTETP